MQRLRLLLAALMVGLLGASACGAAETAPLFKGVKVIKYGEDLGVEISTDRDIVYSCSEMPQLLRVVIDLPGTDPGRPDALYKVQSSLISTIRLQKKSINDVTVTRISVNLAEDADFTARVDAADKTKLTVLLRKAARVSAPAPALAARSAVSPASSLSSSLSTSSSPSTSSTPSSAAGQKRDQQSPLRRPVAAVAPFAKPVIKPVVPGTVQPVTVSAVRFGADAIEIQTAGLVPSFKAFTLGDPGRLVIDRPAAKTSLDSITVPANRFGVVAARIGSAEGKLRLVFVAGQKPFPGYRVEKTETGLHVVIDR
jgi:hypothetical protein